MIRRPTPPDSFLLITQHDHALLSGQLARRLGNPTFAAPSPYEITVEGIAHHDCGWPLHDDNPTLSRDGLPLHVFEVPAPLATEVWSASVARAMNLGDYQGLLVSLHVLGLSAFALSHMIKDASRTDIFEINKFQHRQVEIQEDLRRRLGLRTDIPLHLGLAKPGTSPADDQLLFNFRLLTALDRLSLTLCTGQLLFPSIDDVLPHPGRPPLPIRLQMPDPATLTLDPWPFDQPELTFQVPARRVPNHPFADIDAFQSTYRAATPEPLTLTVRCG